MAKNFGKANSVNKIKEVAKASGEKANVIQVKMISSDNLVNYPRNNEDVSNTEDLELSIKQNGFTDPIEVTGYGMEDGKYLIVSGHRRRAAGEKQGITVFPCIIRTFKSDGDIYNYVLLANSQRDSSKDPLLYCKRYKMHEEYLKESGFKGSVRNEIAKRLGLSSQQADRYKQMNDITLLVWDMIKDDKVGMSSVLPMAQFTLDAQAEIVAIFNECLENGQSLTREMCKRIIEGYKEGKKTYLDIVQPSIEDISKVSRPSGSGSVTNVNPEPSETKEKTKNRNDEVNYDLSHREGLETSDKYKDERLTEDDKTVIEKTENKKKPQDETEKRLANGDKINGLIEKLENTLNDFYAFKDKDAALAAMNAMSGIAKVIFCEMESIKDSYKIDGKKFKDMMDSLAKDLSTYK